MLSLRCKKIVREELRRLDCKHTISPFWAIVFPEDTEPHKIITLKRNLLRSGMDMLDLHESMLVDKIISTIIEIVHEFDDLPSLTYSEIIAKNIYETNESVMKIFTEVVGMSVIQFIVSQKVDRIKELLLYDDLSLLEISKKLNYKSEHHLIAQFKKYTGLTPDHFCKLKEERSKIIAQSMQESKEKMAYKNKPVG